MQSGVLPDLLVDESPAARRSSAALLFVASAALACNCLLNSPPRFSDQLMQSASPFKYVVFALGLGAKFPTARGVEISNLFFGVGAVLLASIAAIRLITARIRPRLTPDDFLDIRQRLGSPYVWWLLLLLVSALSSAFADAQRPRILIGQTLVRCIQLAWWWPLAALLTVDHARRLTKTLVAFLAATALVGLWYQLERSPPRLKYPIGNELWLAACLLPGIILAAAFALERARRRPTAWRIVFGVAALLIALVVVLFTQSRSAMAGLYAGAVIFATLAMPRRWAPLILLVGILGAVAGSWYFLSYRPHSIRTRLHYEWPYALALFDEKKITGHGDGAYALLAGRFARDDQLEDPNAIGFDNETSWMGHAHNEFLELMSDLGLAGVLAFTGILTTTLLHAVRFCRMARDKAELQNDRWLVVALSAALVALVVDQCLEPAFRQPGLPPILLTVWACLWATVRRIRIVERSDEGVQRLAGWNVNLAGAAFAVAALFLGYFAVRDWQAALAHQRARTAGAVGRFSDAIADADFARRHTLDPLQSLIVQQHWIAAQRQALHHALDQSPGAPAPAALAIGQSAWSAIDELDTAAPRFLGVSVLRAELAADLAQAYRRLGEPQNQHHFERMYLEALAAARRDDPFSFIKLRALWLAAPPTSARERISWFREFLRAGEAPTEAVALFRQLDPMPDFTATVTDLTAVASQDFGRVIDQWQDRLSPETFRVRALAESLQGRHAEAVLFTDKAITLYERVGIRLFAAHSAALHEWVRYDLAAAPAAARERLQTRLDKLATSFELRRGAGELSSVPPPSQPLPDRWGWTRLDVLLASGDEAAAEAQLRILDPTDVRPMPARLAESYVHLAGRFAEALRPPDACLRWLDRAWALVPGSLEACRVAMLVHLGRNEDDRALQMSRRLLESTRPRSDAEQYLARLRERFPNSTVWSSLDLPPPTTKPDSND